MSLSRRQFFGNFWGGKKNEAQRSVRMRALETYVRTSLLPYDFAITAQQDAEIFSAARSLMAQTSDEDLFAYTMRVRLEDMVRAKLAPWREESLNQDRAYRNKEIRESAIDYVHHFLTVEATDAMIDHLKIRFEVADRETLQSVLENKIREWMAGVDEKQVLDYNVFSVKELVFSQLRSWC